MQELIAKAIADYEGSKCQSEALSTVSEKQKASSQLGAKVKRSKSSDSGKPVSDMSTEVIRYLSEKSKQSFPIIGVGGIHTAEDALAKIKAGATLVQIYTGFIYKGPQLIKDINKKLIKK